MTVTTIVITTVKGQQGTDYQIKFPNYLDSTQYFANGVRGPNLNENNQNGGQFGSGAGRIPVLPSAPIPIVPQPSPPFHNQLPQQQQQQPPRQQFGTISAQRPTFPDNYEYIREFSWDLFKVCYFMSDTIFKCVFVIILKNQTEILHRTSWNSMENSVINFIWVL